MSRDTATIIPFPRAAEHQPSSKPLPSSRLSRLAKLQAAQNRNGDSGSAIPLAMAMCTSKPGQLPDPVIVAKIVIGFAKRKGIAMTSIPKLFREQLLTLCASGDPAALMLQDWLEGNRKLLAIDGMHEADGTGEGA